MNTFKNDINSAETTAEKKAKEMLTTLTSLSSSISSIELSIVDSNALLKETQDKLKNITSKIPLLQSIGMYHFNNEKDNLVKNLKGI
jgi:predicted  nucleic acid-binding Zn-ribbon protein